MADFQVDAELVIRTRAAQQGMQQLSDRLGNLSSRLRGGESAGMGFMGSMLATSAITAGMGLLGGAVRNVTSGVLDLTNQMQGAQIGIATMIAGFNQVSFERAQGEASALYGQIQTLALDSTATSSQLQDAFQTMYAGMAAAGMQAGQQMDMLAGTATAAAAYMGNDLGQTSRDMAMIMNGMAGAQVKLWRPLQHLIGMTAEEWNTMAKAHPEEAARRLQEQLGSESMQAAGRAYGRSLAGAMSTAEDFIEHFKRTAFAPLANAFGAQLNKLNEWVRAHREQLDRFFTTVGDRMGNLFKRYAVAVGARLSYIADHWQEIVTKVHVAMSYMRTLGAHLMATAKVWLAVRVGMMAAAMAMTVASKAAAAAATIQETAGFFREGGTFLGAGLRGAGAAAGAGGAGAGAAGAAGAAGGAGVMAGLTTIMEALTPLMGPFVLLLAAVGSVVTYVSDKWDRLASALAPFMLVLGSIYTDFMTFGEGLWALIEPFAQVIGAFLTFAGIFFGGALLGVIKLLSAGFRMLGLGMKWVGEKLSWLTDFIVEGFTVAIEAMGEALSAVIAFLDTEVGRLSLKVGKDGRATTRPGEGQDRVDTAERERRPDVNINNARITVNQEFREADPDRVAIRMIEDIARFAEQRIMSGAAPALTR